MDQKDSPLALVKEMYGSRPTGSSDGRARATVDLVIGFDLGTSCSKVVIGDNGLRGKSYAVVFDQGANGIDRYLLPTRYRPSGGSFVIGGKPHPSSIGNLKLQVMDAIRSGSDAEVAVSQLAIYVALVLRQVLAWFQGGYGRDYLEYNVCWHLNVGFPGKHVSGALLNAYRAAFLGANVLAAGDAQITEESALALLNNPPNPVPTGGLASQEHINFYPEIAAQLAGYVKSPYRRLGNLLLVDIGAGTLDISTLIIHSQQQEEVCSFHFCDVQPLGAFHLMDRRLEALRSRWELLLRDDIKRFYDGTQHVPGHLRAFLKTDGPAPAGMQKSFVEASETFGADCRRACMAQLTRFKDSQKRIHATHRHPWRETLPFLLSGGGSRLVFYSDVLGEPLEQELSFFTPWSREATQRKRAGHGFEAVHFPMPEDLDDEAQLIRADFDRISVAHGLAYGAENLMKITTTIESDS